MPFDVSGPLQQALSKLNGEKTRIERQIAALRLALRASGSPIGDGNRSLRRPGRKRGRKRMSTSERKAVATRMKAYWAKRRRSSAKKAK